MTGPTIESTTPAPGPSPRPARPTLAPASGRAASVLLPGERDARRDSRRTSAALVTIVAMAFVLLNLIVYQSVRTRLVDDRWGQMASAIVDKQQDVGTVLQ